MGGSPASARHLLVAGLVALSALGPAAALPLVHDAPWLGWGIVEAETRYVNPFVEPSLVLDVADQPHLATSVEEDWLWSAYYYRPVDPGLWARELVAADHWAVSLALDNQGAAHLAYIGELPDFDLKYAKRTSTAWLHEVVDANAVVGEARILVDEAARVHIVYGTLSDTLRHAMRDPANGTWTIEVIDTGTDAWGSSDAVLDSAGRMHVVYPGLVGGNGEVR